MIAMLPSLRTSLKKKTFLNREVNNTNSNNLTKNSTEASSLKKKNHTNKVVNTNNLKNLTRNSTNSTSTSLKNLFKREVNKTGSLNSTNHSSSLTKRNLFKNKVNNTKSLNITDNSTETTDCEEVDFYVKIDQEIQNHINRIRAVFIDRSVKLEKLIKSEKNVKLRESYRKKLDDLLNNDLEELKVIEELFKDIQSDTLNLKNNVCKKQALKQLNSTKRHINSFIQIMNGVLTQSGEKSKKVSFL
jgi:hypothetical protein